MKPLDRIARWSAAGVLAGAIVGALLLLASRSVLERFDVGTPADNVVELVPVEDYCDEALKRFDALYPFARAHRSCSTAEDCARVAHPVGCTTVIARDHAGAFEARVREIDALRQAAHGACSLPVAMCTRSYLPECIAGQCTISQPASKPHDPR